MKNKAFTYVLLALVVSLWGYVIYKIFAAVAGEEEQLVSTTKPVTMEIDNLNYYQDKDTLSLSLAYRDPIYKSESIQIEENMDDPINHQTTNSYPQYVPPEPEVSIQYLGFIENENNKKRIAILNIQGKQYMISQNEKQDDVRIVKINQDHIVIRHKQKNKTIYK